VGLFVSSGTNLHLQHGPVGDLNLPRELFLHTCGISQTKSADGVVALNPIGQLLQGHPQEIIGGGLCGVGISGRAHLR
jgi:hypothetical protein